MALNPLEITGGLAIGEGVGGAIADVVRPRLQNLANSQWSGHADKPLSAQEAAELAAQGSDSPYASYIEALNTGYNAERFADLVFLASSAPGVPEALYLWRRDLITEDQARTAVKKSGLLAEYVEPVLELFGERIDPSLIAVMVQRGILPNPGLLPVGPPSGVGQVPPMPVIDIDPVAEAKAHGIDEERLAAMARIIGLPASPDLAARMVFRRIIDRVDFDRAIAEGNTRNEWAPFLFEGFREIPTAHDFIEGRLRAWIDDAGMYAGTGRHGMSEDDTDLLFKVTGRPLSWHQVFIGLRRGGEYDGGTGDIDPAFLKSLEESNIRPEWYSLAWANRYSYPSPFVLRAITEAGEISQADAETILLDIGWPEALAAKVAASWAGGTATTSKLTPAQIRLAYKHAIIDLATAAADLEAKGYTAEDAAIYLAISPPSTAAAPAAPPAAPPA